MSIQNTSEQREHVKAVFAAALTRFRPDPLLLGHFDADGLAAMAILKRSMAAVDIGILHRIVGKGENPWTPELRAEIRGRGLGGLVVADLGVREGEIAPEIPTIIIDHHVPTGTPGVSTVISGHGSTPEPTSALLAFWCVQGIADPDDLLWLAAIGLIGDMAEDGAFLEMEEAQRRYGKTALRNAVRLINAPRRSAKADASPALELMLKCNSPKELLSGEHAETAALIATRDEVRSAMEEAKGAPPRIRGEVALISLASLCQIHPLIAQQWRTRLRDKIVIAANKAYRPGWVHFAARTGSGQDLIQFFAKHRPEGAGNEFGSGHRQASGGALRHEQWNSFISELGFPEEQIA